MVDNLASTTDSKKQFLTRQIAAMDAERSSFVPHWMELSEYVSPRRGRFFITDRNRGEKRYKNIINSTATQAHKKARAGMQAGIASPTQKWFGIETYDPSLMDYQEVRMWCNDARKVIEGIYNRSNFYTTTSAMLGELILFGTGAMSQEKDAESVVRFYTHTIGSYYIGRNAQGRVNAFARKWQMTVEQLVTEYGIENVSEGVANLYKSGNRAAWVTVVQYIGDNADYDGTKSYSKNKKITSCTWEAGDGVGTTSSAGTPSVPDSKFLRESGYDSFRFYVPAWDLTGEDIYGTDCPGMVALGDIKQLQIEERRKAQAIDKFVNPPLKGPSSLRNVPVSALPGGLTVYDQGMDKEGLAPIYQIDPRINELMQDIETIERRIGTTFFNDILFPITQMEGIQPKNEMELTFRNQERLLELGPVLERLYVDFIQKVVEDTFAIASEMGLLPEPPPQLEGAGLKITFTSTLAMAQRSQNISAIQDYRLYVSQLASGGFPEAVDKFDADQSMDEISLAFGVPASITRSDDAAAQIRQDRMKQSQQEQTQAQQAQLTQQLIDRQ